MKIFGEAFNRLKSLLAPNAAPKTPPTFAPQANFSPSPSAASAAFQNVAGYVQNPEAPPSPFVDDLKSVESASREKNRSLVVSAGGKPGLLEADRAFLREMLTQAGVPNPSDAEIRRFKENVRTVTGKPIGVLADDGQVRAAAAADGRIRVDYSDYDAGVIAAGAKDILRRRAATQATAERAHAAGTKYVDEAVGGFYGNQVNAAIDLANLATKIPRSVTGTLGLPIGRIGKAGTALIVGATATAGTQAVTGQDVETGRKLTPVERGLNGLGAVGGAAATRTEVGQVVAKAEEAAKRAAGKFPSGGGPAAQAITNEGLTVTVPQRTDKAAKAAEETNLLAKSAGSKTNGKVGGAYKDVATTQNGIKGEVHHMPANKVSPLSFEQGPGIWMEKADHARTASFGSSESAKAYRAQQQMLIRHGRFREAQQMDIDNIRALFGNKYDRAIQEVLEYTDSLEKSGKLPKLIQ
jgi:hypothetical protein